MDIISGLNVLLANTYSLAASTQKAHWNLMGPSFFTLHKEFGTQYDQLSGNVDLIAERIRALGKFPIGGLTQMLAYTELTEMQDDASAQEMVLYLSVSHQELLDQAHELREACGKKDDLETQDFVMGIIQEHQKTLWMLNSYLGIQNNEKES